MWRHPTRSVQQKHELPQFDNTKKLLSSSTVRPPTTSEYTSKGMEAKKHIEEDQSDTVESKKDEKSFSVAKFKEFLSSINMNSELVKSNPMDNRLFKAKTKGRESIL